tara:strand:+ start:5733 stop:7982 length:2250 start_codon:yes stop_codon:yes gene_type:complete
MANPNKFTSKEVLNKVLLDSSGNAVTANSVTSQEALNSVLDTTNNRLNMSLAGGTISGDVTISGDLTVSGSNTYTYDEQIDGQLWLKDSTASSATQGGHLRLFSDDGAAMAAGHRLGVIEFAGAEDASSTITVGARIEALAESTYTSSENGSQLSFYTTDADASQSEVLTLGSNKAATFAAEVISKASLQVQTGGGTAIGSITSSAGLLSIQGDSDRDVVIGSSNNVNRLYVDTSTGFVQLGNSVDKAADSPLHLRVEGGGNDVLTNGIKMEDPAISGTEHLGILFSGRTDNPGGKAYMGAVRADNYGVMDLVFYTDSAADDASVTPSDNVMTFTHDGLLGIGETSPASYDSAGNNLVISNSGGNAGMTIRSSTSGTTAIHFADGTSGSESYRGIIRYSHSNDNLQFGVEGTNYRFKLDNDSRISLSNNDSGTSNTIFGKNAGDSDGAGDYNVFVGELAGGSGTQTDDADNNVGLGYNALNALTTGDSNTAVGAYALTDNLTGEYNIAIGVEALKNPQAPSKNIMIGYQAGLATTLNVPTANIGVGYQALKSLSNGNFNVALGTNAGDVISTGDNCVVLGHGADPSGADAQNQIVIGASTTGTGDNEIALGNTSISAIKAQVTSITAYSSDERTKKDVADYDLKGVDFIKELNLKTYIYKNPADFPDEIRSSKWDEEGVERPKDPTETQVGLIAQEVEAALAKHGVGNVETYALTQDSGIKTLTYGNLIFPLIKAVQELSARVEELEGK